VSCSLSLTSVSLPTNLWSRHQCTLQLKQALISFKPLRSQWASKSSSLSKRISQPKCKPHSWSLQRKCQISPLSTRTWLLTSTPRRGSWRQQLTSTLITLTCRDLPHTTTRNRSQMQISPSTQKCTKWTHACLSVTLTIWSLSHKLSLATSSSQVRLKGRDYHPRTNSQLTLWWRWIRTHPWSRELKRESVWSAISSIKTTSVPTQWARSTSDWLRSS